MAERATWLVATREIREATRSTAFRVSVILSALALAAIIVIANLGKGGPDTTDVVVAGPADAARVEGFTALGRQSGLHLDVTTAPDDQAAAAQVDHGQADVAGADRSWRGRRRPASGDGCDRVAAADDGAILVGTQHMMSTPPPWPSSHRR
jgi:ABC-type Na+ efflux pump permease subunit